MSSCTRESGPEGGTAPRAASSAQPAPAVSAPPAAGLAGAASTIYPLDHWAREIRGTSPPACPEVTLIEFRGANIAFHPAARVIEPFREPLTQLEQLVEQLSLRFYGRRPSQILVASSYDCRSVSGRRRLSEHALGNAIDISGFRFDAAPVVSADGRVHPTALPAPFEVLVEEHWKARGDAVVRRHARFLEELTRELSDRQVFRTLIGPADPDHRDHFHFDMSPWTHVEL